MPIQSRNAASHVPVESLFVSSFPTARSDGDAVFHTGFNEWFRWDATNSAWIGMEREAIFGKGATGLNDTYLRYGHAINSATRGKLLPYDIVVTGIVASWTVTATTGNLRVRRDGANVLSANLAGVATSNTTLQHVDQYATFAAHSGSGVDGLMQVYIDTFNAAVSHPHVTVYYRRRET